MRAAGPLARIKIRRERTMGSVMGAKSYGESSVASRARKIDLTLPCSNGARIFSASKFEGWKRVVQPAIRSHFAWNQGAGLVKRKVFADRASNVHLYTIQPSSG